MSSEGLGADSERSQGGEPLGDGSLRSSTSSTGSRGRRMPDQYRTAPASGSVQWFQREASKVIVPDRDLPAPPSMRQVPAQESTTADKAPKETVAVFNSNTAGGKSMVRALSKSGCDVVAIVRVFTSKNTNHFLKLANVSVKVADLQDEAAVVRALVGVNRAFLCLKSWEKFESRLEEEQAQLVLRACETSRVPHLVFSTFEDTKKLRDSGDKSQIVPNQDGLVKPDFSAMKAIKKEAKTRKVQLTHMITSYLDQEQSKKSLCLLVGENGRLIIN